MRFKEWCLLHHKITGFTEAKIINRVFLPEIPRNRPALSQLMLDNGGFKTTHIGIKGLTFTKQQYNRLLQALTDHFTAINPHNRDSATITDYITRYFYQLGFDSTAIMQHRFPPGIHISFEDRQASKNFLKEFSRFKPRARYNFLINAYVVEMPAHFLNFLYDSYDRSMATNIPSPNELPRLKKQQFRLEQLLGQMQRNNLMTGLNFTQNMALDYDNDNSNTHNICSAYAMSLKIYAELRKDSLSSIDYNILYSASTLLAAYDRHGNLKQSLKSDTLFVHYIRTTLYKKYLKTLDYDYKTEGYPLLHELPQTTSELIFKEIDTYTTHILHGHDKTRLTKNKFLTTLRFLPDEQNRSDTDEIILRSGGQNGHFANFRLIKVAVYLNPEDLMKHHPHHFVYFKVENNLGINCHYPNTKIKTCLGTYVSIITPCDYNDNGVLMRLNIDPYTQPADYRAAMEKTLKELIRVERQLLFYRQHYKNTHSEGVHKEKNEWERLNGLNQYLSGHPYNFPILYLAQDPLNPCMKYFCRVEHQRGYMQEGGSCPVFSTKSLVSSVIGYELAALHNHFMQQHSAFDYMNALKQKITFYAQAISKISPLIIKGDTDEINGKVKRFKQCMGVGDIPLPGLTVLSTPDLNESSIIISDLWLKNLWNKFISHGTNNHNRNQGQTTNPHQFFNPKQLFNPGPEAASYELQNIVMK